MIDMLGFIVSSCRPTFEFTGLRCFLRRSGGMIGWASARHTNDVEIHLEGLDRQCFEMQGSIGQMIETPQYVRAPHTIGCLLPECSLRALGEKKTSIVVG